MISAFFIGFMVGFSLIFAIGAQNAFVLRNGLLDNRIGLIVLFCAFSDTFLIILGVSSISILLNGILLDYGNWIFYLTTFWLFIYGCLRIKAAFLNCDNAYKLSKGASSVHSIFFQLFIFTFLNPHVYLDTVVLLGIISSKFDGTLKVAFTFGAICASFLFFISLGYGARYASRFMGSPRFLRKLDIGIATLMFILAWGFFVEGMTFQQS